MPHSEGKCHLQHHSIRSEGIYHLIPVLDHLSCWKNSTSRIYCERSLGKSEGWKDTQDHEWAAGWRQASDCYRLDHTSLLLSFRSAPVSGKKAKHFWNAVQYHLDVCRLLFLDRFMLTPKSIVYSRTFSNLQVQLTAARKLTFCGNPELGRFYVSSQPGSILWQHWGADGFILMASTSDSFDDRWMKRRLVSIITTYFALIWCSFILILFLYHKSVLEPFNDSCARCSGILLTNFNHPSVCRRHSVTWKLPISINI